MRKRNRIISVLICFALIIGITFIPISAVTENVAAATQGNSRISVNIPNPTIAVGEKITLEVYTDVGADISCDWDNDNVECEWGDWFGTNDENSYFYITGVSDGTSVVTIYDDADNSVKATINVTIGNGAAQPGNTKITVNKPNPTVKVGEKMTLEVYPCGFLPP